MVTDTEVSDQAAVSNGADAVIGRIRTPFSDQVELPRPSRDNTHRGMALVLERYAAGLKDLSGFDRIWLIYRTAFVRAIRLLVKPVSCQDAHGLFATREQARPSRIGMTCVRLLHVRGMQLVVEGVDMLDNSPLLDIRPYIPDFDAFTTSWAGWSERAPALVEQWPLRKLART